MSDYIESLFQGVEILIDKKLEDLAFDTTLICTIVDNTNCKNGEYRVTDGNTVYLVYSENPDYEQGEQVRVVIPNNDYSRRKFIIGKYGSEDNDIPITYVSSVDSTVNISGNLLDKKDQLKTFGIIMNGPQIQKIIWNTNVLGATNMEHFQQSGMYDTLLVKADFQTIMGTYQPTEGEYGLQIDLLVKASELSSTFLRKSFQFTSNDFFGDPYNFNIPSSQSKAFSLKNIKGTIIGIELTLFQNNNFKDKNGKNISYVDLITQKTTYPAIDHIIVNNIEIAFGTDVNNMKDNELKIYSPDSLEYNYYTPTSETNQKKIGLVWYNKNDLNKYLGFSDGIYDPSYDEVKYLKIANIDNKLKAQRGLPGIPEDKYGLQLASDLQDFQNYLSEVSKAFTQSLYSALTNFQNKISPLNNYYIYYDSNKNQQVTKDEKEAGKGYKKISEDLLAFNNTLASRVDKIINGDNEFYGFNQKKAYYLDLLDNISKKITNSIDEDYEINTNNLKEQFITILNDLQEDINNIEQTIENHFPSYVEVMENHKTIITNAINKIQNILNKFPVFDLSTSFSKDNVKLTNNEYLTYDVQNLIENKKKEYFNLLEETVVEKELTENLQSYQEMNLSAYSKRYCVYWYKFNKGYYNEADDYQFLGKDWELIQATEKYQRNEINSETGEIINSSEFTFQNVGIPKDLNNPYWTPVLCEADKGFIIQDMAYDEKEQKYMAILFYNHEMFRSNELVFTNRDEIPNASILDKTDGLMIEHLVDSFDHYPLYNEINYLQDGANAFKSRQLRCHFNGVRSSDNDILPGSYLYWYIPKDSMITFDARDLTEKKGFCSDYNLIEEERPSYSKPGYDCFYKKIKDYWVEQQKPKTEEEDQKLTDQDRWYQQDCDTRDFWYKIKDYYEPNAGKNHIVCNLVLKDGINNYDTTISFTFGLIGNSGTNYTLSIVNKNGSAALQKEKNLLVEVSLRDGNNERVSLNLTEQYRDKEDELFQFRTHTDLQIKSITAQTENEIECIDRYTDKSNSPCGILQVQLPKQMVADDKIITLSQLHPIPWSNGDYYLSGVTKIVYNNLGTLDKTSVFNLPYKLFDLYTGDEISGLSWRIKYYDKDGNDLNEKFTSLLPTLTQKNYIEKVDQTNNSKINRYFLTPPSLFDSNIGVNYFIVVEAYTKKDEVEIIEWRQPLIIIQNKYESPLLNDWNGQFNIDESGNMIMSAMLGAGKKNDDNSFSGVLMGDLTLAEVDTTTMGLYGFYKGAQSFGFKADGTAFIGTSGSGRIEFNGKSGIIQSAKYSESNQEGMKIDLEKGAIDAYKFKLTSKNVCIDSGLEETDPVYFQIKVPIKDKENTYGDLMYVSEDKWYLQSYNYAKATALSEQININWPNLGGSYNENGEFVPVSASLKSLTPGLKIDLNTGMLQSIPESFNKDIEDKNLGRLIINQPALGNTIALAAGDNFLVSGNGDFRLKGDWEIWAQNSDGSFDGSTGLSPQGVFRSRKLVATEKGETFWDKLTSNDERMTSWEEIADVSYRLKKMQLEMLQGEVTQGITSFLGPVFAALIKAFSEGFVGFIQSEAGTLVTEELIEALKSGIKSLFDIWKSDDDKKEEEEAT